MLVDSRSGGVAFLTLWKHYDVRGSVDFRAVFLSTVFLVLTACARAEHHASDVVLSYERRSPWCANCPHYRVAFSSDGVVRFAGLSGCAAPGEHVVRVAPEVFDGLREAFARADFFGVPRLDTKARTTHADHITLAYRDNRRVHEVIDTGSRVPAIAAVQDHLLQAMTIVEHLIEPSVDAYRRLLAEGWQINTTGADGENALTTAIARDPASARFLLAHGATVSRKALRMAVTVADPDLTRALLASRGLDMNADEARELVALAAGDSTPNLKTLLDAGADPNASTRNDTALAAAVRSGAAERVRLLLTRGADIRRSPGIIHDALSQNDSGMITLLARHGASANTQDREGRTALLKASDSCKYWLVEPLLKAGANPLIAARDGRTALQPLNGTLARTESCMKSAAMLRAAAESYR